MITVDVIYSGSPSEVVWELLYKDCPRTLPLIFDPIKLDYYYPEIVHSVYKECTSLMAGCTQEEIDTNYELKLITGVRFSLMGVEYLSTCYYEDFHSLVCEEISVKGHACLQTKTVDELRTNAVRIYNECRDKKVKKPAKKSVKKAVKKSVKK